METNNKTKTLAFNGQNIEICGNKINLIYGLPGTGKNLLLKKIALESNDDIKIILAQEDIPCNNGFQFKYEDSDSQKKFIYDLCDDVWARRRLYIDYNFKSKQEPPSTLYIIRATDLSDKLFDKLDFIVGHNLIESVNVIILLCLDEIGGHWNFKNTNLICTNKTNIEKTLYMGNNSKIDRMKYFGSVIPTDLSIPNLVGNSLKYNEELLYKMSKMKLPVILGKNEKTNSTLAVDLQSAFSGLICGGAGSGTTYLMESMILQTSMYNKSEEVDFTVMDPKGDGQLKEVLEELPNKFNYTTSLSSMLELIHILATEEIEVRQTKFISKNVSNINKYNETVNTSEKIPYKFVFIDELASLIDHAKAENCLEQFNKDIKTLLTKARAAGIYTYIFSHRFISYLEKNVRDMVPLKIVLRSEKLIQDLFDIQTKELGDFKMLIQTGEEEPTVYDTLMLGLSDNDILKIAKTVKESQ